MLTVTKRAKARLLQALRQHTEDPDKAIRLILAPSLFSPIGFILDEQEAADHVVRDEGGRKVLLVAPQVGAALEESVIDYCETHAGSAFTLCRLGPVN